MNHPRIVSFGEIMLRLTPPDRLRFDQTDLLRANYGGSEANVAVSLAHYGLSSELVTRLPANRMAEACLKDLHGHGVETPHLLRGGDRLGLYYMEEAAALRTAHVVYDRAGSSFNALRPGMIDWDEVFRDAVWFHWSGISTAVTADTAAAVAEAVAAARKAGLVISCDLNYRKNLWNYGKEPQEVLPPLVEQCDVLFGTDDEYARILELRLPAFEARDASYRPDRQGYEAALGRLAARFPRCLRLAVGLRNVLSADHHLISGALYADGRIYTSRTYDVDCVIDCVGVGDAFVGGLIYGLLRHAGEMQFALDFGTAACALKNTVPGDYGRFTAEEVAALARGPVTGRIAR